MMITNNNIERVNKKHTLLSKHSKQVSVVKMLSCDFLNVFYLLPILLAQPVMHFIIYSMFTNMCMFVYQRNQLRQSLTINGVSYLHTEWAVSLNLITLF